MFHVIGLLNPSTATAYIATARTACSFWKHVLKALATTVALLSNIASSLGASKGSSIATAIKALWV
jgi:hypothetical protein